MTELGRRGRIVVRRALALPIFRRSVLWQIGAVLLILSLMGCAGTAADFAELQPVLRHLMQSRILIREFGDVPGLDNCARITVGARKENDALLEALSRFERESDG